MCVKEDIECFVVGNPKNLDGTNTDMTLPVKRFITRLQKLYPDITSFQIDERFTSKIAKKAILTSGAEEKEEIKL